MRAEDMLTRETLAAYEVFREQVRTNPALADAWGETGAHTALEGAARRSVVTILERPGVGASNTAFHVIRGLRDRGIPQRALGYGDRGSIRDLAPYRAFDAAIAVRDPSESWAALRGLLAGLIDECAPRAVVTQREFPWAWMLAELRAGRPDLRSIVTCNGGPLLFRVRDTPLEREMAAALARADLVVAISKYVRDHLVRRLGLEAGKVTVIRGGYDPEIFHARGREENDGPLRVAYVGRLEPDKAPDRFVEVVRLVSEAGVPLRATIVGDGAMRPELERSASRIAPLGAVRFTGSVGSRRVAEVLRRSEVLVVPSRTEGLGIQTLEALACGVAVVASRVGGLKEILSESRAGLLASSTDEMAAMLGSLAGDEALRRELAEAGPAFLSREHMDWESVADCWEHQLDRISPDVTPSDPSP